MELLKRTLLVLACVGLIASGCTVSDDERCPSGWFFAKSIKVCCPLGESIFVEETGKCIPTLLGEDAVTNNCNADEQYLKFKYKANPDEATSTEVERCCSTDITYFAAADTTCAEIVDTDTGPDTTNTDTSAKELGVGESCTEGGTECDNFIANFCAVNPLDKDNAYCTTLDCESKDDCEATYSCCDCTQGGPLPEVVVCLNSNDAPLASTAAGCTCN